MSGTKHKVLNVVAIILIIIGVVLLVYAIWRHTKINAINNSWPRVTGTIIAVGAQPANNINKDNILIDPNYIVLENPGSNATYVPKVFYQYQIGNQVYESSGFIYAGGKHYTADEVKDILSRVPVGSSVPVAVNKNKLSESYLYGGKSDYWGIISGIIIAVIGILLLALANKKGSKKEGKAKKEIEHVRIINSEYRVEPRIGSSNRPVNSMGFNSLY